MTAHSEINSSSQDRILNFWKWTVVAAPFWWVLGLNLFIYQVIALLLFIRTVMAQQWSDRKIYLPAPSLILLLLSVIYFFSILIHANSFPVSRVFASFYNLTYWVMGFFISVVLANTFSALHMRLFLSTFYRLAWIMGILAGGMLLIALSIGQPVIFPTPLYSLAGYFGNADLFAQSLTIQLLSEDWFASVLRLRFNAFSPYPTATGGLSMITLMMILTLAAIEKRIKRPLFLILFALNVCALLMSLSRISVTVFVLSIVAVFFLQKKRILVGGLVLLCIIGLTGSWILSAADAIWSMREGSSEGRFQLYQYSLQQLRGIDWILGVGMKNRDDTAFIYPVGSHSTYVSLCVKTGILGLSAFLLFQGTLFWRWFSLQKLAIVEKDHFLFLRGLGWVFLAMMLWTITEDIDAPQLVAFLYFSLVGAFEGMRRALIR